MLVEDKFVVVVDHGGRQYLGKQVSCDAEVVELQDHLSYIEQRITAPGGRGEQVQVRMQPPSQVFKMESIRLKWLSIEEITDPTMISEYHKVLISVRAAKAGIALSSNMPARPALQGGR